MINTYEEFQKGKNIIDDVFDLTNKITIVDNNLFNYNRWNYNLIKELNPKTMKPVDSALPNVGYGITGNNTVDVFYGEYYKSVDLRISVNTFDNKNVARKLKGFIINFIKLNPTTSDEELESLLYSVATILYATHRVSISSDLMLGIIVQARDVTKGIKTTDPFMVIDTLGEWITKKWYMPTTDQYEALELFNAASKGIHATLNNSKTSIIERFIGHMVGAEMFISKETIIDNLPSIGVEFGINKVNEVMRPYKSEIDYYNNLYFKTSKFSVYNKELQDVKSSKI